MKRFMTLAVTLILAGSLSSASAGCWSQYKAELDSCDRLGGFTEIGCNIDATGYYLACVANAATT